MDEIADSERAPGTKEIRLALRVSVGTARNKGYLVDDEVLSLAGMCVVKALKFWTPKRGKFVTYVTSIFLRAVGRLKRWRGTQYIDESFIERRMRTDAGQRLLMQVPEPLQTICHCVWIERIDKQDVAASFGISLASLDRVLDVVGTKLRKQVDDEPTAI